MSQGDVRKPHLLKFYRNLQGRDFIEYAGLLAEFHAQNDAWMTAHPDAEDRRSIKATLVQLPSESNGNVAVCTSLVVMSSGAEYAEIADAAPNNVGPMLKNALPRMAATRCKGRALRDATNIGTTMYEELPDAEPTENDEGEPGGERPAMNHGGMVAQDGDFEAKPQTVQNPNAPASEKQLAYITRLSVALGQPENPQPGDYTKGLASARIEELNALMRQRQGGQS